MCAPLLDTALARKSTQGCVKALMRRQGGQSSSRRSLQTATIANGRVLLWRLLEAGKGWTEPRSAWDWRIRPGWCSRWFIASQRWVIAI